MPPTSWSEKWLDVPPFALTKRVGCGERRRGTVYFNVMTFLALFDNWSVSQEDRLVWRPDVIGSICFLVASYLAWAEVCHSAGRLRFGDLSWWIVVLNLLGSIAFGVSAIGAFVDPDTGDVTNLRWDNGGTFVGAMCFLVAAVMLIPEARSARAPTADDGREEGDRRQLSGA